jgi:hypothetical protein
MTSVVCIQKAVCLSPETNPTGRTFSGLVHNLQSLGIYSLLFITNKINISSELSGLNFIALFQRPSLTMAVQRVTITNL